MARKKQDKQKDQQEDIFGDLESSFFASGEGDDFWDEEKVEAFEDSVAVKREHEAAARRAAEAAAAAAAAQQPPAATTPPPAEPPPAATPVPAPEPAVPAPQPPEPEPFPPAFAPAPPPVEPAPPSEPPPVEEPEPTLGDAATEDLPLEPAAEPVSPLVPGTVVAPDEDEIPANIFDAPTMIEEDDDEPVMLEEEDSSQIPAVYSEDELRQARIEREALQRARDAEAPPPAPEVAIPEPTPRAPLARYEHSEAAADRWRQAARALEREAEEAADPARCAALYAEAGRIHFSRLANWEEAERLFDKAISAGVDHPQVLKDYAHVVAARGDYRLVRELLVRRAAANRGSEAAEALEDAALVARNNLKQEAAAIALLERALKLEPDDWFALRLLRELHFRAQNWTELAQVLARMADLASYAQKARLLVERGHVLETRLGAPELALASYHAARQAYPTSTPAFLALERLARASGDTAALVSLYREEAEHAQKDDAVFWLGRAARVARASQEPPEVVGAVYERLLELAGTDAAELRHEHQAWLADQGRFAELAQALRAEADVQSPAERSFTLYRLAQLQETSLGQLDLALETYREVIMVDPTATPAVEALARLLGTTGRHAELLEVLESHLGSLDDPNLVVTTLYRMGEICEGPLDDQEGARRYFERILDTAPGYLPALEGLERVYTRLRAWEQLAAVYEQRAILTEDPQGIALQLHRAGSVCEFRMDDHDRARDFYRRALDTVADFPPSLDAFARILEAEGDWDGLARILREAAVVTRDSNEVVSFTYRAARVLADKVGDPEQAIVSLRRCLELSPGFLPAIGLLRELSASTGAWDDVYELQRLEADAAEDLDRRHWRMLAAAEVAHRVPGVDPTAVIREILNEDESHSAATALLEVDALRRGDTTGLIDLYQRLAASSHDETSRVRLAGRIVALATESGDAVTAIQAASELINAADGPRPLAAVARVAEGLGYWEEAQRALEASAPSLHARELARLQEAYQDDPQAVSSAWRALLDADPGDTEAAFGLERALRRAGATEGLAQSHAALADHLEDRAIRSLHALLAGHLHEANGATDDALRFYRIAFDARPGRGKAFDGLLRLTLQKRDPVAVEALFAALPDAPPLDLAAAYEEIGEAELAATIYHEVLLARAAEGDAALLPVLARLEVVLEEVNDWKGVFETLGRRLAVTRHPEERSAVEAKRRWILAEKLSNTDEAWDFYRQLHEEAPNDAEVLEALARIAGARGETGLAMQYLDGLARVAPDPGDAARYHRRIAEVHLAQEEPDHDAARAAFLKALDFEPEDLVALRGLEAIAIHRQDWPNLVGVLARQATIATGADQVALYRRIATIWEQELGDAGVALDSWRKVLDLVPEDEVAILHLVDLSRKAADWEAFAEYGAMRLARLKGAEQSDLQAELGQVYLKHLYREDEALRLLDAASQGPHASRAAAEQLEKIHAAHGAWDQVVDAILRQARATEGTESVKLYLRAAQTRLETLHDRDGAAAIYGQILEVDPANAEALRFRGDYVYKRGNYDVAVEIFERMEPGERDRDLDDFDVKIEVALYYFRFAEALRALGRREGAVRRYENALELNPSHLPSLEAVGPLYMDERRWDDAARVYRQVLQLTGGQGDPGRVANTYTNLGRVELELGNLDKAKKRFNKALELRPNDIRALQGIAAVLFERKDWNSLLNVYNNIIYHAQEPAEVVDAYLTKGFVLDARMSLADKAAQHYEKSLAFNPAQPAALLRLGELALRKQDWPEAVSLADRGLALDIDEPRVEAGLHLVRAVAFGVVGDQGAARDSYASALSTDPTLGEGLGTDMPSAQAIHAVLKQRLQERL